ncbi:MAG: hypothetical protein QOJ94_583 [Sphingomonadales bacterium]|nr:hypothetical protein [Sphingomonadales bacterium]
MGTFPAYEASGIHTDPDQRRYPRGTVAGDFMPRYVCLVYTSFVPTGLVAKHAYFSMPANLQAFATTEFSAVSSSGNWASAPIRQDVNFENFTFGSQQLIVFHVDPGGTPVRFDPANLVQFAEFSAQGAPRARNNSFLNAELRSWPGKEVLVLENWFVDDNGQPIAPPLEFLHTMNVHLLMRCALAGADDRPHELPVILDPDTGNGTGNEP